MSAGRSPYALSVESFNGKPKASAYMETYTGVLPLSEKLVEVTKDA